MAYTNGIYCNTRNKNVEQVKENFDVFDFKLTDEDMKEISKINKNERYYTRANDMLKQFATWQPEYEKE